jgi:hypothetical protein
MRITKEFDDVQPWSKAYYYYSFANDKFLYLFYKFNDDGFGLSENNSNHIRNLIFKIRFS